MTISWRRLLRVPWTARRSNQAILKEIPTLQVSAVVPFPGVPRLCREPQGRVLAARDRWPMNRFATFCLDAWMHLCQTLC